MKIFTDFRKFCFLNPLSHFIEVLPDLKIIWIWRWNSPNSFWIKMGRKKNHILVIYVLNFERKTEWVHIMVDCAVEWMVLCFVLIAINRNWIDLFFFSFLNPNIFSISQPATMFHDVHNMMMWTKKCFSMYKKCSFLILHF